MFKINESTTPALGGFNELVAAGPALGQLNTLAQTAPTSGSTGNPGGVVDTHSTTVIAVKYKDGIINVADRRATAGYTVMYDQAEKVLALDDHTLISISGSFAKSIEVVRFLRHSFKYFERSQLQPMSLDGKLMELSRVIAQNLPAAMSGVGAFIPVLSTFDTQANTGRIFFYDVMGGQFETAEFGAAGSGSGPIRGVFEYIIKQKGPFTSMSREDALHECLSLLEIAADLDVATGGAYKWLPAAKWIDAEGIHDFSDDEIRAGLGSTPAVSQISSPAR